ncbi:MAG: EAL domain-containing protein [Gloeomargaritaceae cyanobacterium C42_A2020_066]|nr:EAL domain-containing protein [Gloeomargaritaceae cyanobacterium C42_A2020_066]
MDGLLVGQKAILEMIARGVDLHTVLTQLVLTLEDQGDGLIGSLLLLDGDGRMHHGVAPHLPQAYVTAVEGVAIGPQVGSCGTAMYLRQPVIVTDIAQDPLWEAYREIALQFGLAACWSVPVLDQKGEPLGAFGLYYTAPRAPSTWEWELLKTGQSLAAIALEHHRTAVELVRSQARYRQLLQGAADAILVADVDTGLILEANQKAAELLGIPVAALVRQKHTVIHPPDQADEYRQLFLNHAQQGGGVAGELELWHRAGRPIAVEVLASVIELDGQRVMQGIFRDIRDRKRAEERLRQREQSLAVLVQLQQTLLAQPDLTDVDQQAVLALLGPAVQADRVIWVLDSGNRGTPSLTEWTQAGGVALGRDWVMTIPGWQPMVAQGAMIVGLTQALPPQVRVPLAHAGVAAILVLPLQVQGRPAGHLVFERTTVAQPWDEAEVDLLQAAAASLCLALARSWAASDLLQKQQQALSLADVGLKIQQASDLESILDAAVTTVQRCLGVDRAVIFQAMAAAAPVIAAECLGPDRLPWTADVATLKVWLPDLTAHGVWAIQGDVPGKHPLGEALQCSACLSVPISQQGQPWGLLMAHHHLPRQWRPAEVELLQHLANQVGIALHQMVLTAALRQREAQFRLVVETQTELIYQTDVQGRLTFVNAAFCHYAGRPAEVLLGQPFCHPLSPVDQERFAKLLATAATRPAEPLECQAQTPDGPRWHQWTAHVLHDAFGQPLGWQCMGREVTEWKQLEAQLVHDALHDPLTGLPNRVLFMDRLSQIVRRRRASENQAFAVLFLDLDRFKVINDSLGHLAGDQLLVTLSHRLQSTLRTGDTVSRLGGDEFALLLDNLATLQDVDIAVQRLQAAVSVPIHLSGHPITVSASIGVVFQTAGGASPEDLLRDADLAMYQAKKQGRARHVVFASPMHTQALADLRLESDLRGALERGEFLLHYLPVMDLVRHQVVGLEALPRWHHPERGLLPPSTFIPLAEETGLILPLETWVVRTALTQMSTWQQRYPHAGKLGLHLNVSSQNLTSDLVSQFRALLATTALSSAQITLEITETALLTAGDHVQDILCQLHALGLQLGVDDFGAGYASLKHLYKLRLQSLKVDRSLIADLAASPPSRELIQAILVLAQSLNLVAVAEGIETDQQAAELRDLGCHLGQGLLFGRPLSAAAVDALLAGQFSGTTEVVAGGRPPHRSEASLSPSL